MLLLPATADSAIIFFIFSVSMFMEARLWYRTHTPYRIRRDIYGYKGYVIMALSIMAIASCITAIIYMIALS